MVLRDIIATQNFQIQTMLGILEEKNFPETKDCIVEVPATTERVIEDLSNDETYSEKDVSKSVSDQASGVSLRASPAIACAMFSLCLLYL